ncbi:MAG: hypothetical protein IJ191_09365, partial [Treponema sp.]|nr:hypothetical protein [Treponema sp.]
MEVKKMREALRKNPTQFFVTVLCIAIMGMGQAFSKPKSESVKEKEGFYYGYGKAATEDEAIALAKKDLIETALTATLRQSNSRARRITISETVVPNRLVNSKPSYQNPKNKTSVYFEISVKDWEKDSKAFDDKLRASL